jgi:hypothetical protein
MGIKFITIFICRNSNSDKNENLRLYGAFEANIKDRYGNDTYEIAGIAFMGNDFNMQKDLFLFFYTYCIIVRISFKTVLGTTLLSCHKK